MVRLGGIQWLRRRIVHSLTPLKVKTSHVRRQNLEIDATLYRRDIPSRSHLNPPRIRYTRALLPTRPSRELARRVFLKRMRAARRRQVQADCPVCCQGSGRCDPPLRDALGRPRPGAAYACGHSRLLALLEHRLRHAPVSLRPNGGRLGSSRISRVTIRASLVRHTDQPASASCSLNTTR